MSSNGDNDDKFDIIDDEEIDEEEIEHVHSKLIAAINNFASQPEAPISSRLKTSSNSISKDAAVSLHTLLGALSDSKDLRVVKRNLDDLEVKFMAPKKVEKVVSQRIERSLQYDSSKEDVSKWQELVITNRHVKTLDLANDRRHFQTHKQLVNKFTPETEMEKEIHMVLLKTNSTDSLVQGNEVDELRAQNLSPQQIRNKQASLAKVKALMFYEQMKRHRLNKIKSKAYHRIRKKQKLSQEKRQLWDTSAVATDEMNNDDDDKVEREKEELKRIQERMDLKHKNTSKWCRMALKYGKSDVALRTAYHESVLLGQELSKKIHSTVGEDKVGVDDDSDAEFDDDKDASVTQRTARALKKYVDLLAEEVNSGHASASALDLESDKYAKLFDMGFMQKASQRQQEKAREDAIQVLSELNEMENASEGFNVDGDGGDKRPLVRLTNGMKNTDFDEQTRIEARQVIDRLLAGSFGEASTPATTAASTATNAAHTTSVNPWLDSAVFAKHNSNSSSNRTGVKVRSSNANDAIYVQIDNLLNSSNQAPKSLVEVSRHTMANVATPEIQADIEEHNSKPHRTEKNADATKSTNTLVAPQTSMKRRNELKPILLQTSQADLVQQAFSAPDLQEDFNQLKHDAVDKELNVDGKTQKALSAVKPGWGDWTGPGQGRNNSSCNYLLKREKILKRVTEETDAKKAARKDAKIFNVILSEDRIKLASKYKIAKVPHPFTTREEYERSLQMPLGNDWNASHVVRENTKPDVSLRAGRLIEPAKLQKGKRREPQQTSFEVATTSIKKAKA